jgi:hypothetical protein
VTYKKIMSSLRNTNEKIGVEVGFGGAGWRKRLRINTDKRSLKSLLRTGATRGR